MRRVFVHKDAFTHLFTPCDLQGGGLFTNIVSDMLSTKTAIPGSSCGIIQSAQELACRRIIKVMSVSYFTHYGVLRRPN
jgi:hypothetical protein